MIVTPTVLSAHSLKSTEVTNRDDESLGKVEELMIDLDSGQVEYAVLRFTHGFLKMNEKLFAVPWQAFDIDIHEQKFILNKTPERLKEAPGFDKNDWPDMADPTFKQNMHNFYSPQKKAA